MFYNLYDTKWKIDPCLQLTIHSDNLVTATYVIILLLNNVYHN